MAGNKSISHKTRWSGRKEIRKINQEQKDARLGKRAVEQHHESPKYWL